MRNNILVNNTAYYNSSLNERGSSIKVLNYTVDGTVEKNVPFTAINNNSVKVRSERILADNIAITVKNTTKDEETLKLKRCDYHVLTKEYDFINLMAIDFKYNGISIKNGRAYSINIIEPRDKYDSFDSIKLNVENRINFNFEYSKELVELNNVFYKTFNEYSDTKSDLLIVNNMIQNSTELNSSFKHVGVHVLTRPEEEILIREEAAIAIKVDKKSDDGWENKPVIQVDVNNIMTGGGVTEGTNTGGDLKVLSFTIQQMSFFEFKLKFESKKVDDVFNLPTGLFFDKERQVIIGTPMQSGRYAFSLLFDNNSTLNGFIDVPKIQREL